MFLVWGTMLAVVDQGLDGVRCCSGFRLFERFSQSPLATFEQFKHTERFL
jgi:hypothetical protein